MKDNLPAPLAERIDDTYLNSSTHMAASINYPASTYRIQFNKEFSLKSLEKVTEYLQRLGVQTIYASPIFKAVPGSSHGYDVTDPLQVNPEVGSLEQLRETIARLKQKEIGWLQDIVPNHMAFHHDNEWLMDVLEKGNRSMYISFFDIEQGNRGNAEDKLMVPFLGEPFETVLEQSQLNIVYKNKRLLVKYFDSFYPLNAAGYLLVLNCDFANMSSEIDQLAGQFKNAEGISDVGVYNKQWKKLLSRLYRLNKTQETSHFLQQRLQQINSSIEYIRAIADRQFYRLCHWQEAEHRINYRRFFLVNGLICLNIQHENVFDYYHQLIGSLVEEGAVSGLRVDHIDGLYDPAGYLKRLREFVGGKLYQVVEKILEPGETLPAQLAAEGTTGYDFLALVDNLFSNQKNAEQFASFYEELADEYTPVHDQIHDKKAFILERFMAGELDNLYDLLLITVDKRLLASVYKEDLRVAVGEFLVCCPVYRYYADSIPFDDENALSIKNIITQMRERGRTSKEALHLLEKLFLEIPTNAEDELKQRILHFYRRCMQFTGPLMAKGVEDTLMYTYNSFIAHNEVGDSSLLFGIKVNEFNQAMIERQKNWPLTLNATSTHDTKRGEDVRARLNVLSDIPNNWFEVIRQWRKMNHSLKQNNIPAATEEYFIYQSLVGGYPMQMCTHDQFVTRFEGYLIKSLREAKVNSSWESPEKEYESLCIEFSRKLLQTDSLFMRSFLDFHNQIVDFGIVNSLAQLLLKFTCPGIPDTYQGRENWDLSFVDPDNRRAVDFDHHFELLNALGTESKEKLIESLWKNRSTGQIKLWLTQTLLRLRKKQAEFFKNADYVSLKVEGEFCDFAFAFARNEGQKWLIVVIPLHLAELCRLQGTDDIFSLDWKDTHVVLPDGLKKTGEDVFLVKEIETKQELPVKKLFKRFPLALLRLESKDNRSFRFLPGTNSVNRGTVNSGATTGKQP